MADVRRFNPSQKRDPNGEWGDGAPGASALKDALKLAGKIDLAPDEKLIGSGKVDGDQAGIRMALTERGGRRMLRLGVGGDGYGKADRDTGTPAWDGNHARTQLPEADRQRLDAEFDALDEEYDTASPARQAEISARQDAIKELLPGPDDDEFNGTAKLDEYSMARLADRIRPALAEAVEQNKAENDAWDEIEALEAKGNPDPARMAKLRETARADSTDFITFSEGIIPGSEWGDVHYSVELDDPTTGATVRLGVWPKGAPDDWGSGRDWGGQFDAAETRKFLRLLDKMVKPPDEANGRNRRDRSETRVADEHIFEDGICISCADDEPDGPLDEHTQALLTAISELGSASRAFNPDAHPRNPKGSPGGGKFRSNVDRLKDALKAHKAGSGTGDPFEGFDREQLRRVAKARGIELKRGEGRDSIAGKLKAHLDDGAAKPAEPRKPAAPAKRAPAKKASAKQAPAEKTDLADRSSGTDLIGSDPAALARRVAKDREHHVAADRSLSAIGHEQGFDGKPRVVSKDEMDRLVADGNTEIFRGVKALDDGKTAAEIHQDMRDGHAWYGLGIYGNGYYWGGPDHAAKFADKTPGSTARAVLDPNAKVIEFWGDLYPEHEKFMEQHKGTPDETHINDVYSDPGRYAAARGYDVIKIVPNKGEPWYNVLNRTALVIEEA